jgi:hypothetical protein
MIRKKEKVWCSYCQDKQTVGRCKSCEDAVCGDCKIRGYCPTCAEVVTNNVAPCNERMKE